MKCAHSALRAATALGLALAALGPAQAMAIDPFFRTGSGQWAEYDASNPSAAVLRVSEPGWLTGSTRTLDIAPTAGASGSLLMGVGRSGESALYISSSSGQRLSATLSYGLESPLNLDLSAQGALVLHPWFGDAEKLTVYAWTEAPTPGDNPWGSAISVDLGFLYESSVVLPFSSFALNSSAGLPVNWADVDGLSFVFSGSAGRNVGLYGISAAPLPVPEPAAWAMLAAGALLVLRRGRGGACQRLSRAGA